MVVLGKSGKVQGAPPMGMDVDDDDDKPKKQNDKQNDNNNNHTYNNDTYNHRRDNLWHPPPSGPPRQFAFHP